MKEPVQLEKCPFCGSKKVRIKTVRHYSNCGSYVKFWPQCTCGISGPEQWSIEKVAEQWNTRKEAGK